MVETSAPLIIGKSVPRKDGVVKVTGRAPYIYDMNLPSALHGKIKRSPYAHAQIFSINTKKAEKAPGVRAVITGRDAGSGLYGLGIYDTPVLARDVVRYVGEPVAAVAADSPESAEEAVDLLEVEYRELPALLDPEQALSEDPPIRVHDDLGAYARAAVHAPTPHPRRPNVSNYVTISTGDLQRGFTSAHLVLEERYTAPMIHHCPLEPHVALACWQEDDNVTVWTSTQSLYRVRAELNQALRIPMSKIRVISSYVGGGFGSKVSVNVEAVTALLARKARRPVKISLTRSEIFTGTSPRHSFIVYLKDGVSREGRLLARHVRIILDGGAFSGGSGYMVARTCVTPAIANYRVDNLLLESYRVCTHKVSGGTWRGVGEAQVNWAIEEQMDTLASELNLDPVEFRRWNLFSEGETTATGARLTSHSADRCLTSVTEILRKNLTSPHVEDPWRLGRGVALAVGPAGGRGEGSAALVKVHPDGTLDLLVGGAEIGQGTYTVMAQIVAEEFRTSLERVRIAMPDTFYSPFDPGAFASRQTFIQGNAVRRACADVKAQIFAKAASILDAQADQLEIVEGRIFVRGDQSRSIRLEELFRGRTRMGPFLEDLGEFIGRGSWGVSVTEVGGEKPLTGGERTEVSVTSAATGAILAVNTETGQLRPIRLVVAVDVGKAINPALALEQIRGGAAMGLSTALSEELVFEDGQIVNPDFKDYKLLSSMDSCSIEPILIENPHTEGPYGAKGIGEIPTVSVASAIGNALYHAIGVRMLDLPLTAEKVLVRYGGRRIPPNRYECPQRPGEGRDDV